MITSGYYWVRYKYNIGCDLSQDPLHKNCCDPEIAYYDADTNLWFSINNEGLIKDTDYLVIKKVSIDYQLDGANRKRILPIDIDWTDKLAEQISIIIYDFAKSNKLFHDIRALPTAIKILKEIQMTLDNQGLIFIKNNGE